MKTSAIKMAIAGLAALAIAWAAPALAQTTSAGVPLVPLGYCQMTSLGSSVGPTAANCVRASFTGTGSGTSLTTTAVTGTIRVGDLLAGTGVTSGTYIAAQISGTTGGAGVYRTSVATTSSGASLTSGGIPNGSTGVFFTVEAQAIRYRDDGGAPTSGVGMPVAVAVPTFYVGTLTALRFIEQTSGAKINLSFYRWP